MTVLKRLGAGRCAGVLGAAPIGGVIIKRKDVTVVAVDQHVGAGGSRANARRDDRGDNDHDPAAHPRRLTPRRGHVSPYRHNSASAWASASVYRQAAVRPNERGRGASNGRSDSGAERTRRRQPGNENHARRGGQARPRHDKRGRRLPAAPADSAGAPHGPASRGENAPPRLPRRALPPPIYGCRLETPRRRMLPCEPFSA